MNKFEYGDHTSVCLSTDPARKNLQHYVLETIAQWKFGDISKVAFISFFLSFSTHRHAHTYVQCLTHT